MRACELLVVLVVLFLIGCWLAERYSPTGRAISRYVNAVREYGADSPEAQRAREELQ